jgi:hypothetical protein
MKTTKTYKSLPNAYAAAEKAGAKQFDLSYEPILVTNCVGHAFKSKSACKVALWNLVKYENTLYALEEVQNGYKWTAIGHFDSDGLLYPMGTEAPKQTEDKPQKPTPRKPASVGKGKALGKADKKAIRSECYKLAKGNREEYDRLCAERGVDNHRG